MHSLALNDSKLLVTVRLWFNDKQRNVNKERLSISKDRQCYPAETKATSRNINQSLGMALSIDCGISPNFPMASKCQPEVGQDCLNAINHHLTLRKGKNPDQLPPPHPNKGAPKRLFQLGGIDSNEDQENGTNSYQPEIWPDRKSDCVFFYSSKPYRNGSNGKCHWFVKKVASLSQRII